MRERFGRSAFEPRRLILLPVLFATALAYHEVATFDTYAPVASPLPDAEEWLFSPVGNNSPLLIYVLTAWMALRRLPRLLNTLGAGERVAIGALGSVAALGLLVWAHYIAAPDLVIGSLSLLLVSGGLFLAGREGGRAMLLPAIFMAALAIPLPAVLINALIFPLQLFTAEGTVVLLNFFGVVSSSSADLILRPEAVFHVIETCSGMRMIQILLMSSVVYAEVMHRSRRRLVSLLLLAPFVGVFVNQFRVLSLVLNPFSDQVPVHTAQGLAMMVVGVLVIALLDSALQRLVPDAPVPARSFGRQRGGGGPAPSLPRWRIALLTGGLILAAIATFRVAPWVPGPASLPSVHSIPRVVGEWDMETPVLVASSSYLGTTRFSQNTYRRYVRPDGETVDFFIGVNDRVHRFTSVLSRKTETLRMGSRAVERSVVRVPSDGQEVSEVLVVDATGGQWLVHHAYDGVAGLWYETFRAALGLDRGFLRRSGRSSVTRIAARVGNGAGDREDVRQRLFEFSRAIGQEIDRVQGRAGVERGPMPEAG